MSAPGGSIVHIKGQIYLAGPFTALTEAVPNHEVSAPFGATAYVLGEQSPWRRMLEDTAAALEAGGWTVFLPHRDVSRWGWREIERGDVARECLEAVMLSDVVLGFAGESFGTHVELGVALGNGIPTVVLRSDDVAESYFGAGFAESGLVASLSFSTFAEIPTAIVDGRLTDALDRAHRSSRQISKV